MQYVLSLSLAPFRSPRAVWQTGLNLLLIAAIAVPGALVLPRLSGVDGIALYNFLLGMAVLVCCVPRPQTEACHAAINNAAGYLAVFGGPTTAVYAAIVTQSWWSMLGIVLSVVVVWRFPWRQ